jgi:hypothetical protein
MCLLKRPSIGFETPALDVDDVVVDVGTAVVVDNNSVDAFNFLLNDVKVEVVGFEFKL